MSEEQVWREFNEALENLKHVHTKEELKNAQKKLRVVRDRLLVVSEKFRQEYNQRKQTVRARVRHNLTDFSEVEHWMINPYLENINDKLLHRACASSLELVCPSCGSKDHGNRLNTKPWCFRCNVMLVPKVIASNYSKLKQRRKFSDEERMKGWY